MNKLVNEQYNILELFVEYGLRNSNYGKIIPPQHLANCIRAQGITGAFGFYKISINAVKYEVDQYISQFGISLESLGVAPCTIPSMFVGIRTKYDQPEMLSGIDPVTQRDIYVPKIQV